VATHFAVAQSALAAGVGLLDGASRPLYLAGSRQLLWAYDPRQRHRVMAPYRVHRVSGQTTAPAFRYRGAVAIIACLLLAVIVHL
jgi:hypothetical protein